MRLIIHAPVSQAFKQVIVCYCHCFEAVLKQIVEFTFKHKNIKKNKYCKCLAQ